MEKQTTLILILHLVIFIICLDSAIKSFKNKEYSDSNFWSFAAGMWLVFLMNSIIDLLEVFSLI
jgi:hypothetical protein